MEGLTDFFKAFEQWYRDQLPGDVLLIKRSCKHYEEYRLNPQFHMLEQIYTEMRLKCRYCKDGQSEKASLI